MYDKEYFSALYEIASHLNKEFSLQAALHKALEKTVSLLDLETGWIWLVQSDNKSVYLAASYELPPALSKHPERLSGWCYCLEKYFANAVSEATNISEIRCTRLKDLQTDTRDLMFHATVPIFVKGEKMGLLNLLSKESQQLDEQQLAVLNTISELIGMAIHRTRLQEAFTLSPNRSLDSIQTVLNRILAPRLDTLLSHLREVQTESYLSEKKLTEAVKMVEDLEAQLVLISKESSAETTQSSETAQIHYPTSPLTPRELEVLSLVKKGLTNPQIAEQLFIAERTVKFHISAILSKLHAKTRTEAVDTALRRGLLGG